MAKKVSVVITVLNEQATIIALLKALADQSFQPDQVIIVDGGSNDQTVAFIEKIKKQNVPFDLLLLIKAGNRSVGRNYGITKAKNEVIAITDAGCLPHTDWLEELVKAYESKQTSVVAGYYDADPQTAFEAAVVPYVLVMPDKVNPEDFLPATRSMLIEKSAWEKVGGFDETLSDNEDYAFAHALRKAGIKMSFTRHAKVTWMPRSNLRDFYVMIERFARGDIQAGIVRKKVLALFGRYVALGVIILFLLIFYSSDLVPVVLLLFLSYGLWAIWKNIKYAPLGWFWLPVLQFTADVAVLKGSLSGWLK